jgi:hypothetical protein
MHMRPYLANYAALGLAQATQATGDTKFVTAAWQWLTWYQRHEGASGYVFDYDRDSSGTLVSTRDMDSTDAYAGTFLTAVQAAYAVSGDIKAVRSLRAAVAAAVQAIYSTQQPSGLTWAKPSWPVAYLMDQAETYAGLRSAVVLLRILGDSAGATRADRAAARLRAGVDHLWNPSTSSYDWAEHADGARVPTDWHNLYPDGLQQVWAVAYGLVSPARAVALMAQFEAHQTSWDSPGAPAVVDGVRQPAGYWAVGGWAYLRIGKISRAAAAEQRIRSAAASSLRAWPFTPADAGQLINLGAMNLTLLPS